MDQALFIRKIFNCGHDEMKTKCTVSYIIHDINDIHMCLALCCHLGELNYVLF